MQFQHFLAEVENCLKFPIYFYHFIKWFIWFCVPFQRDANLSSRKRRNKESYYVLTEEKPKNPSTVLSVFSSYLLYYFCPWRSVIIILAVTDLENLLELHLFTKIFSLSFSSGGEEGKPKTREQLFYLNL